MAARFAVITGNWSGAIWAATSGGAAGSAAVPTSADDVTINAGTTVTLDGTNCACSTLTINGTLAASQSVSSTLTAQLGAAGASGGHLNLDVSGNAAITCQFLLNASNNATTQAASFPAGFSVTLKGAVKKRWTRLNGATSAGATSCNVTDATGWRNGDRIILAATDDYLPGNANGWTPHYDEISSITVAGNAISWTGGAAYAHANNSAVGNFTSNLRIGPGVANAKAYFKLANNTATGVLIADHAEFFDLTGNTASPNGSVEINPQSSSTADGGRITGCVFYKSRLTFYNPYYGKTAKSNNVYLGTAAGTTNICHSYTNATFPNVGEDDGAYFGGQNAISGAPYSSKWRRTYLSGFSVVGTAAALVGFGREASTEMIDAEFESNQNNISAGFNGWAAGKLTRAKFNQVSSSYRQLGSTDAMSHTMEDCLFGDAMSFSSGNSLGDWSNIRLINKGQDVTVQEIWTSESYAEPTFSRDNSVANRATSSLKILGTTYGVDRDQSVEFTLAGNTSTVVAGYCKVDAAFYNGGDWYPPTVKAMLGEAELSSYTATSAANGAWQKFELNITNPEATTKTIKVNLRANRKGASGYCWFSGLPMFPIVNQCRHYGYQFNETSPTRAVDSLTSASEATAAAYAGMTITWGASASSTSITASQTVQKLYDYHQSQAVLNVGSALALTGAGVAGSPVLFAAGNVTISDGAVLNGAGSLSMGAYTLSTEFANGSNYTYTGGTWSQLSTVPTFNGGTANIGAEGAYAFTATAALVTCAPSADAVTYEMGGCAFSGAMVFRNTHATRGITVKVPAGTSYTTTTAGGAITVQVASAALTIAANVSLAGAEVHIYDLDSTGNNFGTELVGTESCPGATYDYSGTGGNVVWIQILKAGYEEFGQEFTLPTTSATFTAILKVDLNA